MQSIITINHYKQILQLRELYNHLISYQNANMIMALDAIQILSKYSNFAQIEGKINKYKQNLQQDVFIDELIDLCYDVAKDLFATSYCNLSFTNQELNILKMLAMQPLSKLYAEATNPIVFEQLYDNGYIKYSNDKQLFHLFSGDIQ